MSISKKTGFFLGTAVCLDAVATGGTATLAKIGVASAVQALSNVGASIFSDLAAYEFSKKEDSGLSHELQESFQKATVQTIEAVKQDFITQNNLDVSWWRQQSLKYGFDVPSIDEEFTIQYSLEEHFFNPLVEALTNEDFITQIIDNNRELQPVEMIENIIKAKNIVLPEFRKDHQPAVRKALSEGFRDRFMFYFIQNLNKSEPARKAYITQLLQSSIQYLDSIKVDVQNLLDIAQQ